MKLIFGMLVLSLALSFPSGNAQNSSDPEYLKAVATIYALSKIGGFVKDWCDALLTSSS